MAVLASPDLSQVQQLLSYSKLETLWAIDLETTGLEFYSPAERIVGIGFADETSCFYIHLDGADTEVLEYVADYLRRARLLTAFNVKFDAAFLWRFTGEWLNWDIDSFGLFKQLATEGYPGQRWNLETAQQDVLGWDVSNKDALLVALKLHNLQKHEMSKLPVDILGPYCAADADAAYQLTKHLVGVCEEKGFDELLAYHRREYMASLPMLIEAQGRGIEIDVEGLHSYYADLLERTDATKAAFLAHEKVAPHVAVFNAAQMNSRMSNPPPQFTKKGEVTKRWENWVEGHAAFAEASSFNINSKDALCWLFYEKLGYKIQRTTEKTGRAAMDKKVLPAFGEEGMLLFTYNKLLKEGGYVRAAIEKCKEGNGILHPDFSSVGTITGRIASGG